MPVQIRKQGNLNECAPTDKGIGPKGSFGPFSFRGLQSMEFQDATTEPTKNVRLLGLYSVRARHAVPLKLIYESYMSYTQHIFLEFEDWNSSP